jgi:pimeloyl-ACP methyl ester carboxylesterase
MLRRLLPTLRTLVPATVPGRALLTGTLAVGAVAAGRIASQARRARHGDGPAPADLPPALPAETDSFPLGRWHARTYERTGTGTPIVLLPGVSPVASCHELAPLFEALAEATRRPLGAMDWLGFGRSDRPSIRYHAGLYQRQLLRFLSGIGEPSDVVAWGLGAEYAAAVAVAAPHLVRRLVLVAPSGLERGAEGSLVERVVVGLAGGTGAYRLAFELRARAVGLHRYYAQDVFTTGTPVPEALVEGALLTTGAAGAFHAPRRLAEGLLFMDEYAQRSYAALTRPTLVVLPALTDAVAPHFDALPDIARANEAHLIVTQMETGLLPQWEQPEAFARLVEAFLTTGDVPRHALPPRMRGRRQKKGQAR